QQRTADDAREARQRGEHHGRPEGGQEQSGAGVLVADRRREPAVLERAVVDRDRRQAERSRDDRERAQEQGGLPRPPRQQREQREDREVEQRAVGAVPGVAARL